MLTGIGGAKAASGNPAPEKHALSCAAIRIPAEPCAGRTTLLIAGILLPSRALTAMYCDDV